MTKAKQAKNEAKHALKPVMGMRKSTGAWMTLCALLGGVVLGFLIAPIKNGISIGNNNSNNGNANNAQPQPVQIPEPETVSESVDAEVEDDAE